MNAFDGEALFFSREQEYNEGDNFTAAQKSSRQSERLRIAKENESRLKERIDTMREHRERIASDLGSRMRNTAPNTLKKLRMLHADDVVKTMYDGPTMILEMEAVANEKLATKTDETHNLAKEEYKKWQASPLPPNCTSEVLSKYINTYRLHINPFVEQPKSGSVLSNELLEINFSLVVVAELKKQIEPAALESIKQQVTSAISMTHSVRLSDFVLVGPGSLPLTTSGKVRRASCVELYRTDGFNRLDVTA